MPLPEPWAASSPVSSPCRNYVDSFTWCLIGKKYIGLAYGLQNGRTSAGLRQMGAQLLGIAFVICLNIATTSIICWLIGLIVPLRLSKDELNIGDEAVHGEKAFALVDDRERFEVSPKHNSVYDIEEFSYVGSRSVGEVQMV